MFTTDPRHRKEYIDGLRQLADYLDANPGVPVPGYGTTIMLVASDAENGGIAEIVALSIELAAPFAETDGVYRTQRQFGPITYKGFANSAASLADYSIQTSYYGCVTPDD
jgi:hypothetical protein